MKEISEDIKLKENKIQEIQKDIDQSNEVKRVMLDESIICDENIRKLKFSISEVENHLIEIS